MVNKKVEMMNSATGVLSPHCRVSNRSRLETTAGDRVGDGGWRPRTCIGWTTPVVLVGLLVNSDAASSNNRWTVSPDTPPKPGLPSAVWSSARWEIRGRTPLHRRNRLCEIRRWPPPARGRSRRRLQRGGPWSHVSRRSFAARTGIPGHVGSNQNRRKCKPCRR